MRDGNYLYIRGNTGESVINSILEQSGMKFYQDIYMKNDNGDIAQIDFAVITECSVVAIEVKTYKKCIIKGDLEKGMWTLCYKKHNKSVLSPVIQNQLHVQIVQDCLKDIPVYSIIVIPSDSVIQLNKTKVDNITVTTMSEFWYTLMETRMDKEFNEESKAYVADVMNTFYSQSAILASEHKDKYFK